MRVDKGKGGSFVLRIEDTLLKAYRLEAEQRDFAEGVLRFRDLEKGKTRKITFKTLRRLIEKYEELEPGELGEVWLTWLVCAALKDSDGQQDVGSYYNYDLVQTLTTGKHDEDEVL